MVKIKRQVRILMISGILVVTPVSALGSSVLRLEKAEPAITSSRETESSNAVSGINFDDEEF